MPKPFTFAVVLENVPNFGPDTDCDLYELCLSGCKAEARNGELRLTFTREAETAEVAIDSALADIARANIGGHAQRVERDLRR